MGLLTPRAPYSGSCPSPSCSAHRQQQEQTQKPTWRQPVPDLSFHPPQGPAGGPLKGLGASRCDPHLSLSRLPPGAGRQVSERSLDPALRGAGTGERTTYKELLLALGVSFQNCIRQLCCLTGNKTTPFQVGSTAWRGRAVGAPGPPAVSRACPEHAHSPSSSASSTPCSTSASLCTPGQGNSCL